MLQNPGTSPSSAGRAPRSAGRQHPDGGRAAHLDAGAIDCFRARVYAHYLRHGRDLPWRRTHDPYHILVSELMLQQTQVSRVTRYYPEFLRRFPSSEALAAAPLRDVLLQWSGLGYNRRAQALHRTAAALVAQHHGRVPQSTPALLQLPGIGPATAGALQAFAFDLPAVFVETNIRRVMLHHFFAGQQQVADRAVLAMVAATLDRGHPRRWYYALMDRGAALARGGRNPNRRSAHYSRQAPFAGSDRQLRGLIIRLLATHGCLPAVRVRAECGAEYPAATYTRVLDGLIADGMLGRRGDLVCIADGPAAGGTAAITSSRQRPATP